MKRKAGFIPALLFSGALLLFVLGTVGVQTVKADDGSTTNDTSQVSDDGTSSDTPNVTLPNNDSGDASDTSDANDTDSSTPSTTPPWWLFHHDDNSSTSSSTASSTPFWQGILNWVFPNASSSGELSMASTTGTSTPGSGWWHMFGLGGASTPGSNSSTTSSNGPDFWRNFFHLHPGNASSTESTSTMPTQLKHHATKRHPVLKPESISGTVVSIAGNLVTVSVSSRANRQRSATTQSVTVNVPKNILEEPQPPPNRPLAVGDFVSFNLVLSGGTLVARSMSILSSSIQP